MIIYHLLKTKFRKHVIKTASKSKTCGRFRVTLLFPNNYFPKKQYFKKWAYMYFNDCFLSTNLCWVQNNNNTTLVFLLPNCPQVLKIVYDWPVKHYYWYCCYGTSTFNKRIRRGQANAQICFWICTRLTLYKTYLCYKQVIFCELECIVNS